MTATATVRCAQIDSKSLFHSVLPFQRSPLAIVGHELSLFLHFPSPREQNDSLPSEQFSATLSRTLRWERVYAKTPAQRPTPIPTAIPINHGDSDHLRTSLQKDSIVPLIDAAAEFKAPARGDPPEPILEPQPCSQSSPTPARPPLAIPTTTPFGILILILILSSLIRRVRGGK